MSKANVVLPISVRYTTTDGTVANGATFAPAVGHAYVVDATIIASDGTTTASYGRVGTFEYTAAGTLGQVSTTYAPWSHEDIAAPMNVDLDADDTNKLIRVRVTGDPGRTIKWNIDLNIREIVN